LSRPFRRRNTARENPAILVDVWQFPRKVTLPGFLLYAGWFSLIKQIRMGWIGKLEAKAVRKAESESD
jgi:hypothetical protein